MPVKNRFADLHDKLTAWRHDLHRHPELRFEETRTAGLVAKRLRAFGCDEVHEGFGRTGVVAVIRGRGQGDVIGFRADMDALPITEATGLGYASETKGVMHACGHDGHTTMLLGAAQYLAETRNFSGTVVLAFQPAEEGGGGARAMLADGLVERFGIQEFYGMHNWPGVPVGQFALRDGPLMSAAEAFEITVIGRGGHGARPHMGVDPTLVACQLVSALQSVVARNVDPLRSGVVSVCGIRSDTDTYNVIPDKVTLKGTTRYFDKETGALIQQRIEQLMRSVAEGHGAQTRIRWLESVPPTVNSAHGAQLARDAAEAVTGKPAQEIAPVMPAEDFSELLEAAPGAYIFIGNGESADLHNPAYNFNDEILPLGASLFAELAERRMPLQE